ncbi:MAG: 3-keto-disaccharide hydrolase [Aureliella sp.]
MREQASPATTTSAAASSDSAVADRTKAPAEAAKTAPAAAKEPVAAKEASATTASAAAPVAQPAEISTDELLKSTLGEDRLKEGWVRLFDGYSLFGWFFTGKANWHVADGAIQVDSGEPSFLCTSFQAADYELLVDFKCPAETNSGVFLRTTASPQDVTRDCYELNIAPADNPFPTGSLVKRQKVDAEKMGEVAPDTWHTYRILVEGDSTKVWLDEKPILEYTDAGSLRRGYISLQHNAGAVQFRNILLRPLGMKDVPVDGDWESAWTQAAKPGAKFTVTASDEGLKLKGGLGKVESKDKWDDFVLQATYQLASPDVNSGIFFRCIPGSMLDGYECQLNHAYEGEHRGIPKDFGAGAIFRRQPARVVVGDGTDPTYVTLIAQGNQMATWINGLQVVDFTDTREPNENPRKGSRLEAGTIALQGHDETTEVTFRSIRIAPIAKSE